MDPEFLREWLPYVAQAAAGRALGLTWEQVADELGVPVAMVELMPVMAPEKWAEFHAVAMEEIAHEAGGGGCQARRSH